MQNLLDATTIKAIKQCVTGLKLTETTSEYVLDEDTGQMKLVKKKRVKKPDPPNNNIIKWCNQKQMTKQIIASLQMKNWKIQNKDY